MKLGRFGILLAISAILVLAAGRSFGETEAAKAFKYINDDLGAKARTMAPDEFIAAVEKAMTGFIAHYPKSPEAAQAHFSLGLLYSKTGAHAQAIGRFAACLAMPGAPGDPALSAQAKYFKGISEMAIERFDAAEKTFREILNSKGKIDSRIQEGAKTELSKIAVLRKLRIGAPAADIAGTSLQGKKIRLSTDYRGKVVLLDFWAAWCGPCRMEMPNVMRIYNDLHGKGFEIIGISLDSDRGQFESFVRSNKMEWPQLFDGKYWMSDYAKLYAVNSIPATFLIDRMGVIRFKNVRGEDLRRAVLQLLEEK